MEEPLERKDAAVGIAAKEPLKTEGLVPSPDTSERSEGASSPPPNCSICLGKLRNTSFTDSCLHQFCFTCLLQWSKIKTECPLCKQTFKSIIHNVRSEEDYDQYHVPRELASQLPTQQIASLDVNFELVGGVEGQFRRFVYRTTMTPNRRYGVILNSEQVARREQIPNMMPPTVSREERRFRRVNPTGYRRNVYQQGEWSNFLPNIHGRLRECSAEYYRRNPQELSRLIPWINRELQILLNANESHIAYVLNVITDALSRYDIRGPEFRDTVRPYFGPFTDHFAHELLNYARTSFDLVGYDQYVTYPSRNRGLSSEYVGRVVSPVSSVSSTSSDDSDVRVVDQTIDVSRISVEIPSVGPHVIDMPGPSTVGETFRIPGIMSGSYVLTISSSSSSSDECEVVGYVKPRHERTPEIIELVSSDGGAEPANNRDASCRTPCEQRENDCDRAGPSHEGRRRGTRKLGRPRRPSNLRWSTTSGSNTIDESETEHACRYRKKSSYRAEGRPRARETARKTRATDESERPSQSDTRPRQASCSTSSVDPNCRRSLREGIRDHAETLKQLALAVCDSASEICDSNPSRSSSSSSRSSRSSSSSSDTRSIAARIRKIKVRKGQAPKMSGIYSSSSSSSSSSVSKSDSESAWSGESTSQRQRRARSRRKICQASVSESTQLTPARRRQPVNATILRKDSTKPNEWYVKKKTLRARSLSRSSSSRRSETELRNTTRRRAFDEYKERKESTVGNPGKGCSARTKREPVRDSSASESRSDVTIESNSRGSGISGRTRGKERTRHKDGLKRRMIRSESSDSGRSRPVGGSSSRRRDQESRSDQAKRKDQARRIDRGRKRARLSKVTDQGRRSDQAKRNSHVRNTDQASRDDHARKKGEASKSHDQERKNADQERKKNEQERKTHDPAQGSVHARKSNDPTSRSNGARKKDHGRRNDDDDQAGTSRHSENEKKSISKDKQKRKKKQKVKRRRSRSESKAEYRNSRHRIERSASYSAPTTNRDEH